MSFDIDALTEQLFSGWEGIENAGKAASLARRDDDKRLRDERMREAKIIAKAFAGKNGRAALLLLGQKTLMRSESQEERSAKSAEHYAILKARREGQRDLVFIILDMLRVAAGEDPQPGGDI